MATRSSFRGNMAGAPTDKQAGDWWYDTTDNQYKGYDGTSIVILG